MLGRERERREIVLTLWFDGLLVCWFDGLMVCWFAGLMV